jgi:leucyl-tRNA synthetase
MFLGPIELSKPWDTNGIEGVFRFLNKFWRMFFNNEGRIELSEAEPSGEEQKIIHTLIKKITWDIEKFSFNTSVSAFMIAANDLAKIKSNNREVLTKFIIVLSPFAPHIAEELWQLCGNKGSVVNAYFPEADETYLVENTVTYPVAFNGKTRFMLEIEKDKTKEDIEQIVRNDERTQARMNEGEIKKIIVVPGKMINIVV